MAADKSIHGYRDPRLAGMSSDVISDMMLLADRDFARRSIPGAVIMLLAMMVSTLFLDIATDRPLLFYTVTLLLGSSVASRLFILGALKRQTPQTIYLWQRVFSVAVIITAASWGAFVAGVLQLYGVTIDTLVILLMTIGIAGGAAIALFIWKRLAQLYLMVLMLIPMVAVTGIEQSPISFGLIFAFVVYLVFLLFQVERSNGEYWHALVNTKLLELQTEELTEAKQNAEKANSAKSSFLANMSHELRTPMNAILGFTQIMEGDSSLTPSHRKNIHEINHAGEQLLELINEILDLTKIEEGHLKLENSRIDLFGTIDELATILAPTAHARGIGFELYVAPSLSRYVQGDALRIKQVLTNLVGNAIKFTSEGRVRVEVSEGTEGSYLFSVQDDGIGIDAEVLPTLFKPFIQADASTTRRFGGTGLGLAISYQLVMAMGGEIGVESNSGTGSRFWFSLPLQSVAEDNESVDLAQKRLLSVSSGREEPSSLERYLQHWGATVVRTDSTERAAQLLMADGMKEYDLVLFDEQTPQPLVEQLLDKADALDIMTLCLNRSGTEQGRVNAALKPTRTMQCPVKLSQLAGMAAELFTRPSLRQESQKPAEDSDSPASDRGRVLLVEDNKVNQRVAQKILQKMGFQVTTAGNGVEGLERATQEQYALIFMDIQMPEMDGYEATRAIREGEKTSGRHQTIIAMTANAMSGDREHCLAAGMDDYISKPIKIVELKQKIDQWCVAGEVLVPSGS